MTIQPTNSEFKNDITGLYGDYPGALPFILPNNEVIEVQTLSDIPDGARPLPYSHAGLFFCVGLIEDADRDDYLSCKLKPTLVYYHAGRREQILVWSLKEPVQLEGPWETLPDIFGMDLNVGIPLHGDDGWEIVYRGIDRYTPGELVAAYGPGPEAQQEEQPIASATDVRTKNENKFLDANIKTPFNPDADIYRQPIWVTIGKDRKACNWYPNEKAVIELLEMLCRHEVGDKDGFSFVYANMVQGQRLKTAVKTVTAIGLDIDTGTPKEEIDSALEKFGCLAVRYSTHSNMARESKFKKDAIFKFEPDADEIDSDLMRRYVAQEKWPDGYFVPVG